MSLSICDLQEWEVKRRRRQAGIKTHPALQMDSQRKPSILGGRGVEGWGGAALVSIITGDPLELCHLAMEPWSSKLINIPMHSNSQKPGPWEKDLFRAYPVTLFLKHLLPYCFHFCYLLLFSQVSLLSVSPYVFFKLTLLEHTMLLNYKHEFAK